MSHNSLTALGVYLSQALVSSLVYNHGYRFASAYSIAQQLTKDVEAVAAWASVNQDEGDAAIEEHLNRLFASSIRHFSHIDDPSLNEAVIEDLLGCVAHASHHILNGKTTTP